MTEKDDDRIPLLLWPFYAAWRFVTFILMAVGRLICGAIGLALMFAGAAITMSIVAAPIGIPIVALGFLLLIRALF